MPAGSPGVMTSVWSDSDFDKRIFPDFTNPIINFLIKGLIPEIVAHLVAFKRLTEILNSAARHFQKMEAKLASKNWADVVNLGFGDGFLKGADKFITAAPTEVAAI